MKMCQQFMGLTVGGSYQRERESGQGGVATPGRTSEDGRYVAKRASWAGRIKS